MRIRKRGMHRNKVKGFYFKGNRIVLENTKSKIAFFGILFLFGVVIATAILDINDSRIGLQERFNGDVGGVVGMSPNDTLITLEGTSEVDQGAEG